MPKRLLTTDIWSDADFEELSMKAKYLFLYLVTSPHTSQAGMGQATDKKIANDTDIEREDIPSIFEELSQMVSRNQEWFWIKNFLKHQCCNASFAKGALKYANNTPFYDEFLNFNEAIISKFNINRSEQIRSDQEVSTPYCNGMDTVSTPCRHSDNTVSDKNTPQHLLKPLRKISPSPLEIKNLREAIKAGCTVETVENLLKRKPGITGFSHQWQIDELMAQKRIDESESTSGFDPEAYFNSFPKGDS